MGQYGFCASKSSEKTNLVKISSLNVGGVDVKEFKKVKNLFHKKSDDNSQNDPYQSGPSLNNASQNNTSQSDAAAIKKNLGFEKTELDNSTFSIFEDESIDEFGQSSDSDSSLGKKDKKNKKIKEKQEK